MYQSQTRTSLLTRVVRAEERARTSPRPSQHARDREPSFVERYRGTDWETPSSPVVVVEAPPARGHAFVWVTLGAMVGTTALLIGGSSF